MPITPARGRTATPHGVWMQLDKERRRRLERLMVIKGVSGRQLAKAAGWTSHTYLQRLLRGEVNTLRVQPALNIARFLDVDVNSIFLVDASSATGNSSRQHRKLEGRAA